MTDIRNLVDDYHVIKRLEIQPNSYNRLTIDIEIKNDYLRRDVEKILNQAIDEVKEKMIPRLQNLIKEEAQKL